MISEEFLESLEDACDHADLKELRSLLDGELLANVKFTDVFNKESSPIGLVLKAYGVPFNQKLDAIKFLLIKGDAPDLRKELGDKEKDNQFFIDIVESYLQNPIPEELDSQVDAKLKTEWDKCTQPIIKAIETAAKTTQEKHDGFKFRVTGGRIYVESINHGMHDDIVKKKINETLYCMDDNDAIKELPARIRSGLQKLVDKNIFDPIMSSDTFPIIIHNGYSNHLAKKEIIVTAHNKTILETARKDWKTKLAAFLQAENKHSQLGDISSTLFFGKGITEPEPQKAIDLAFEVLYQSKSYEEQREIKALLWEFEQNKDFYIDIQFRIAMFYKDTGSIDTAIEYLKYIKSYAPAQKELDALGYKEKKTPLDINKYTKADLNYKNKNINAKASKKGSVEIKFIHETEDAYLDAMNFLNNLMDKGYSKLFGGYQLDVTFINNPNYLNIENFPKAPIHAFFANAATYPALHEKIRQYALDTLEMYDWYKDLDGENCAGTGTFAACALALRDSCHLDLLSLLADETDSEHQELQINMIPAIIKLYGVTPTTIPTIFDLVLSYAQFYEVDLPAELYTEKENLGAVLKHSEQIKDSSVGYFIDHWFNYDDMDKTLQTLENLAKSANKDMLEMYQKLIEKYQAYLTQFD